jgi:hypothetical protein
VSQSLSAVPPARRRRFAGALALFAALFVAIGVVAATGARTSAGPVFCVVALLVAAVLALMVWGVLHSIRIDAADASVDEAIEQAVRHYGGPLCDCGHEHDPTELHITDAEPCAHDGTGASCSHDCQTCVLAALRTR